METRSRHSSPSRFRSSTERLALVAGLALAACGDDGGDAECGPGTAPPAGIVVKPAATDGAGFGQVRSSPNNDCTPPGGDAVSLTIQAAQTEPADDTRFLVLCLPRPDRIGSDPVALDDSETVQLVDLLATPADGCRLALDRDRAPSGDITFSGFCEDGVHPDGYALAFSASVPLLRTCGEEDPEPVDAALTGSASVVSGSL